MNEHKFATYDAAYVLGALSPADRHAFEEHLSTCSSCAESVAELAGMPGLLARVPLSDVLDSGPPEPMPESLLPGLFDEVARKRRRRRWVTGSTAVLAAACLVILLVIALVPGGTTPATSPGRPMAAVAAAPIHATASITNVGWGSKISVKCGYDPGVYGVRKYALTVTDKQRHTDQVATWMVAPGKMVVVNGSSSLHTSDIASIDITSATGQPLLQLTP